MEDLIKNTQIQYNNPKQFWNSVSRQMGSETNTAYIKHKNEKIYDDQEKKALHKTYWQEVFQITQEANQSFNNQHEAVVNEFIEQHRHRTNPHHAADNSRLNEDCLIILNTRHKEEVELTKL